MDEKTKAKESYIAKKIRSENRFSMIDQFATVCFSLFNHSFCMKNVTLLCSGSPFLGFRLLSVPVRIALLFYHLLTVVWYTVWFDVNSASGLTEVFLDPLLS